MDVRDTGGQTEGEMHIIGVNEQQRGASKKRETRVCTM
jgi:hypothetical protein